MTLSRRDTVLLALVFAVGSLQIVGWVTGWDGLRKAGQLTAASPLPLVFSSHDGWETFSPKFTIEVRFKDGFKERVEVDPRAYSRLPGPYNRRNVYGAVISFGPVLKEENRRKMRDQVLFYAFCHEGPLARLSSRPGEVYEAVVHAEPRASGGDRTEWAAHVPCGIRP